MRSELNGKTGEVLRWAFVLFLAGVVSYFTSMGTVQTRVAVVETKTQILQDDVTVIKRDVKELLTRVR